jgi:uncharacterized protein
MAPDRSERVSLYKPLDQEGLALDSRFTFQCHADLPCFNQCCRTPTIILSPYDLLRLKECLGITSGKLLQRYTRQEIDQDSHLPLVFLDPYRTGEGGCPFLSAGGCTVYAHRPAACRLFPITMGSRLTPQGVEDYYFYRKLDYCRGFAADTEWTVESWKADQGFAEYDQGRREWLEILLKAGMAEELVVDALTQDLFATLAYDLDRFRTLLFEPAFLQAYEVDARAVAYLETDDLALLKLSYRVVHSILSAEGVASLTAIIRNSTKFFQMD